MIENHPHLVIPKGVSSNQPFVQILDPATGTGTFLVEIIELIHKTMMKIWNDQGKTVNEIRSLWNDYVSEHLLTRIYGFEIMMAPYAVAHLKIGLALQQSGYQLSKTKD